jgi:serine/threonine protein kinase
MPRTLLQIRESFENGDLDKVFKDLKSVKLPLEDGQKDILAILESRFSEINKLNHTGVINTADFNIEENRVRSGLLGIINDLETKQQIQDQEVVSIRLARNEKELLDLIRRKLPPKYSKMEVIWNGDYALIIKALKNEGTYLQESVAIKVFKTISLVDEENLLHLKDEFNISKRLSKRDGIIDIIDEDLELPPRYFIMPYIDGVLLGRYIKNSWSFTLRECLHIFEKLIQAIKEGHDDNLIHQNIRPSNVLIDKWDEPQIQPFQALELAFSRRSIDRVIELSRYWSPEQINAQLLTTRSDQYSLALVGYELFAGEPLFKGETVLEIIQARLNFEKNSEKTLNEALKHTFCPPALILVFLRMLNNDATQRYPDLEDVLHDWRGVQPVRSIDANYDQFRMLKLSYNRCRRSEGFYEKFYKLFFDRSPNSKAVFERVFQENALKHSKRTLSQMWRYQHQMLDLAMSRLLQYQERPEAYLSRLDQLSAGHHAMGVAPQDYAVFLGTLKEMIAQFDAPFWKDKSTELDKAWQLATAQLLAHMENYSGK